MDDVEIAASLRETLWIVLKLGGPLLVAALAVGVAPIGFASAVAMDPYRLSIKEHRFEPAEITVPAGEKFRIEVTNEDPTPEEFESHELKVEKIVVGGSKINVLAGPLPPGLYKVFGDYHPDTAVATVDAVKKD